MTAVMRAQDAQSGFVVRHEFIKRLKARYDAEGIEIPYPIRNLYMRSPLQTEALASPASEGGELG